MSAAQKEPLEGPIVKGWCPGAHRPMMSGDGLVVRVRPFRAELSRAQVLALCDLSDRFGNGVLDLTSRANLQLRGVAPEDHPALLGELDALGLIDADPAVEGHRNILLPPFWTGGGLTDRLYAALLDTLPDLPDLPEKMGFALDTGSTACLRGGSADFRFELDDSGGLMLRADGAAGGKPVTEDTAMDALRDLAQWFIDSDGRSAGRMARHLAQTGLPEGWTCLSPRPDGVPAQPGHAPGGMILGAPFGKMATRDLRRLFDGEATHLRLMLNRLFLVRGSVTDSAGFVTAPGNPLMKTHACPGQPYCPQAQAETMTLARSLAPHVAGTLHVSGCAKGCALPRAADITLTGHAGAYDLIEGGSAADTPTRSGLDAGTLTTLLTSRA